MPHRVPQQQYYELTRKASSPVGLDEVKAYLKIPASVSLDDDLISSLIDTATDYAEKYTGRDVRANRWTLFLDQFPERICLRRDQVDKIISITRVLFGSPVTVLAAVYYIKRHTQFSEVLLNVDQDWPTDQDDIEHSIEVLFQTRASKTVNEIVTGIWRHVAFMYENRGDCPPPTGIGSSTDSAVSSGATKLYDQARIVRV